jgi:DNA-binding XRE family transcriptional regulator
MATGQARRAQVGVTRQTINSIEKGRFHPNLRLAFKIARNR